MIAASAAGTWQWKPIGTTGGPGQRAYSVVAWTGHELLVWGGLPFGIDTAWQNSGWRYDPGTDSWSPMSPTNAPSARQFPVGAWTGSKLVIWGGHKTAGSPDSLQTGASYDPATDTWLPTSQLNAPSKRGDHTMVWTGSKVIVWGGYDFGSSDYLDTGACYDPVTDSWTPVSGVGAPTSRSRHTAVWSGSRMIVWGGGHLSSSIKFRHRPDFGLYDLAGNSWSPGSTLGAPEARSDHSAVWTGSTMIIWGGWNGDRFEEYRLRSGGMFDPANGAWTSLPLAGAPAARDAHCSAWTGREMIVWGGSVDGASQSGARFDPSSGTWSALPTDAAPTGGNRGSAAWNGEAFLVVLNHLACVFETGPYALDGIPDDWQYHCFGSQNPKGAANQDPDADRQDNLMEFLATTNPTDSRSRLTLGLSSLPDSGEIEFQIFPFSPDRRYRLERSDHAASAAWHPADGDWTDLGNRHAAIRTVRPAASRQFYRLAVELN